MPENSTGTSNGTAVAVPVPPTGSTGKSDRYRPNASTTAVQDEVVSALARVVTTAMSNAGSFVYLAEHYDRDATTAIRYGHLVDATECAEIAMTHLGQLKAAMSHRLRIEDAQHAGESPF